MKTIFIPRWRLQVQTSRSSGPGGQGVNTSDTKVEIRFVVDEADWIPEKVRARLKLQCGARINVDGEFILTSQETRSQKMNLERCVEKLQDLLAQALIEPRKRVATKATRSSKRRRVDSKKKKSVIKAGRGKRYSGDD